MKVDSNTLPSSSSYSSDDKRDLEQLLDVFGSTVSLEDIASAYCQSGCNVYAAGEILCNMQGKTPILSSESNDGVEAATASSERSSDYISEKASEERISTISNSKKGSVSMGTVSGVIGREYASHRPLNTESCEVKKPLKLNSDQVGVSEIWGEEASPDVTANNGRVHKEVEEFLYAMLGDGFRLDRNKIREVLGDCGYEVEKSMEKLLDLSESTLENSDEKCTDYLLHRETSRVVDNSRSGKGTAKNGVKAPKGDNSRYNLQRDVLEALFKAPDRFEEEKKGIQLRKEARRSRAIGKIVEGPLNEISAAPTTVTVRPRVAANETEKDEESFDDLSKAAKEYWITMKEYYRASVDAFVKEDHARAEKLMEEGLFFRRKAGEANEKSVQKVLEPSNPNEEVCLDFLHHEPREAVDLLKVHLTSLSGIPSIQFLKLTVETQQTDSKKGSRKRLIKKLLERESIEYTEEEDGRIIAIRVDKIDRKGLRFAKKTSSEC